MFRRSIPSAASSFACSRSVRVVYLKRRSFGGKMALYIATRMPLYAPAKAWLTRLQAACTRDSHGPSVRTLRALRGVWIAALLTVIEDDATVDRSDAVVATEGDGAFGRDLVGAAIIFAMAAFGASDQQAAMNCGRNGLMPPLQYD
eukprot:4561115-Pleurochrysis_carterae.AAC.2